jgi:hypothetical protein
MTQEPLKCANCGHSHIANHDTQVRHLHVARGVCDIYVGGRLTGRHERPRHPETECD